MFRRKKKAEKLSVPIGQVIDIEQTESGLIVIIRLNEDTPQEVINTIIGKVVSPSEKPWYLRWR